MPYGCLLADRKVSSSAETVAGQTGCLASAITLPSAASQTTAIVSPSPPIPPTVSQSLPLSPSVSSPTPPTLSPLPNASHSLTLPPRPHLLPFPPTLSYTSMLYSLAVLLCVAKMTMFTDPSDLWLLSCSVTLGLLAHLHLEIIPGHEFLVSHQSLLL